MGNPRWKVWTNPHMLIVIVNFGVVIGVVKVMHETIYSSILIIV
jgi:nitrogen fixation protein FixH